MSPAASGLICASGSSWGRCLLALGTESWLGSVLPWHGEQLCLDLSHLLNQASPWSVQAKGLNLRGAGSQGAL